MLNLHIPQYTIRYIFLVLKTSSKTVLLQTILTFEPQGSHKITSSLSFPVMSMRWTTWLGPKSSALI